MATKGETIIEIQPEFNDDFNNKKDKEPVESGLVQTKQNAVKKHKKHHKKRKTEEEQDRENVQLDSLFLTIEEKLVEKDPGLEKAKKAIKDTKT